MTSPTAADLPRIIQGGMGVAISSWRLARAVARRGQLGVVSGTGIERILAYRLQDGDVGGDLRRAIAAFPDRELAQRGLAAWHQEAGLPGPGAYRSPPMFTDRPGRALLELAVLASFVEVYLAKEGHTGPVGINLLEKIRPPTLPILYGAMLAGVDWVLMGAGIPRDLPGQLASLAQHAPTDLRIPVEGGEPLTATFDPSIVAGVREPRTPPRALAVVSSDILAASLARHGGFAGFVVENPRAGGHNAPPRGGLAADGTAVYGARDQANVARLRALGLPFWLAGGMASAAAVQEALAVGAAGIQVGTAFALCNDSGMDADLRRRLLAELRAGTLHVRTEGNGSPTGYPFKVATLSGTLGGENPAHRRRQPCTVGALRQPVRLDDGTLVWRCPSEPEHLWQAKGGQLADTVGRRCLCQGLFATVGHAQRAEDGLELPLVTLGEALDDCRRFLAKGADGYDADTVLDDLLEAPGSGASPTNATTARR